jgi:hypothetical protein
MFWRARPHDYRTFLDSHAPDKETVPHCESVVDDGRMELNKPISEITQTS